jgi:hypothetical protein
MRGSLYQNLQTQRASHDGGRARGCDGIERPAGVTISNNRLRALFGGAFVLLLVLVTAEWCWSLIQLGPDADSDAYGHHLAARHLFMHPSNQAVHWVWLPLFHWLQLPLFALGGDIEWVRVFNLGVWALVPLALFGLMVWPRTDPGEPSLRDVVTAASAAALLALSGLGMQLATTAQPEPLFTLLLVLFCWAQERHRRALAALLLTALVLLRYEAWAVLVATGALISLELALLGRSGTRGGPRPSRGALVGAALVVLLPLAAIGIWALMRAPFDGGRYFAFLTDTHEFARHAIGEPAPTSSREALRAFVHYPVFVAARVFGFALVLVPFGVARLWREQRWLLLSGVSVLGFVTLGHATHATLGLERHFVALLPLYAAAIAFGALELVKIARRRFSELGKLERALHAALGLVLLFAVYGRTRPWLRHWGDSIATRFQNEAQVAHYLDGLPEAAQIFCDSPIVEGLVRFRGERVERGVMDDPAFRARILQASSTGDVYVTAPLERLALAALPGKIAFRVERRTRPPASPWDAPDLVVLHVTSDP